MEFKRVRTAVIGCGMISNKYFENITKRFHILDIVGCSDIVSEKSAVSAEKYGI